MNVTVKGRGVEVTPAMRDYAQKKLNKVSEFDSGLRTAEVTYKLDHSVHKVEVMLTGDGVRLRAEERRPDLYEAMDVVVEKLEQQARKHHRRLIDRNRHQLEKPASHAAEPEAAVAADEVDGAGSGVRITRRKRFAMKPMSAIDAAIEMEMMGHEFFVFRNTSGDVNVVYRRDDTTIGLIEVGE
ncbi:MAG TPA: ribosome-associated translation inhibitor RaiA [Armatimonadota bacterium]|jgi:putative sigma-54 modulation protein